MNRRNFLKSAGIATAFTALPFHSAFAKAKKYTLPPTKVLANRLRVGDTIGLIAPGGNVSQKELDESKESLTALGFKTYHTPNILAKDGYLAGTDQQRADDMMHMFTNKEVNAIVCVRGGYGTVRTLDLLDYDTIKSNPKILLGYSDVTALLIALYQKAGLVAFHGPVASSTFNDFTTESFRKVLMEVPDNYKYAYQREAETESNTEFDEYTITSGEAKGELIGGNLVMLQSLIGTAYEPNFENKIIFMEEIKEKPYKIDRMLTHLIMSTNFSKAAGIVCGIFNKCDKNQEDVDSFTLKEVLEKRLSPLNIPCYYGAPFGHVINKLTLPTGINAKIDATKQFIKLLEPSVI